MFLRRFERRKSGKPHTYWALVESYRTGKGSRQRVVSYLGELTANEQDGWPQFCSHLNGEAPARRPERTLFDPPPRDQPQSDEPLLVKLSSIWLERTRDFGDVWLAWGLWRMLGLDDVLERLIEPGREDVSWAAVAAILVIARFCEPSSELHIKEALEKHLQQRLGELFELRCDLLLYDVTSTYFEGEMEGCPLAQRGYSRDSRGDRPQVCIGLVVTEDGYPLGYEVFAGNRHDSTTVQTIIEAMERKHGSLSRVWVMDRGMVSEANLKFLRERGGQYIVGTPKQMLCQFEQHLTEQDWTVAQEGVEVNRAANSNWKSPGSRAPSSATGSSSPRAATCSAATSRASMPRPYGNATSNSPRPNGPFASPKTNSNFARSGIKRRTACKPTSSSASWPTPCGRRWPAG